ncbi:CD80-like immunoglobulin C2-set [Trinorchestia longiramus]|nr:CD80-like immunoglobulin C2-set [Trinorchestia longiramus]
MAAIGTVAWRNQSGVLERLVSVNAGIKVGVIVHTRSRSLKPDHRSLKLILGIPPPTLVWLRDGVVIEDSYNGDLQGQVRNLLHLDHLSRELLDERLTCRASNNNITKPLEASIVINMTLSPLTISLTKSTRGSSRGYDVHGRPKDDQEEPFVRGGVLETLSCRTTGSRPPATVSWWRNDRQLVDNAVQVVEQNLTMSSLSITPTPEDQGVVITCRVENPLINGDIGRPVAKEGWDEGNGVEGGVEWSERGSERRAREMQWQRRRGKRNSGEGRGRGNWSGVRKEEQDMSLEAQRDNIEMVT